MHVLVADAHDSLSRRTTTRATWSVARVMVRSWVPLLSVPPKWRPADSRGGAMLTVGVRPPEAECCRAGLRLYRSPQDMHPEEDSQASQVNRRRSSGTSHTPSGP